MSGQVRPARFAGPSLNDSESLDEIAERSAGQLRFLLNVGDLISGIRGIAIEKSDLSVEVTPRETVEFIRQRHSAC